MTKPIINTEAEYKLVREALQQDLKDKNDKISKLESDNLELINKVNNLMEKNLDLHEKNMKSIQSKEDRFDSGAQLDILAKARVKQGLERRRNPPKRDIFAVDQFESRGAGRGRSGDVAPYVTKSENLREKSNYQQIFDKPNKFDKFVNDQLGKKSGESLGPKQQPFKSERVDKKDSGPDFFDVMPEIDHQNLISQILPICDERADKSGLSRKNEEEILKGLVCYLENNVHSKSQSSPADHSKVTELEFIKNQIEKYMNVSREKESNPQGEALLMDVMASFGKVTPSQSLPRKTSPKKQSFDQKHEQGPFEPERPETESASLNKFQSLEKKYNDLIRLNQETQLQIKELKRERSFTSMTKTTQPKGLADRGLSSPNLKRDELFKKMHEASIEMEVNRESRIFSTNSKKGPGTNMHSVSKRKDMSASSEYLYSNINQIYRDEGAQKQPESEEASVKLSGRALTEDLEASDYQKLKRENTQLLRKINLLRSDLSRFRDNCQSFDQKTEKEVKLMQRVDELEQAVKEKDQKLLELKSKNLDLTKQIFQNKERKKLEEKCAGLQAKLQGGLTRLPERPEELRKEGAQTDQRQEATRKGDAATAQAERGGVRAHHQQVQAHAGGNQRQVPAPRERAQVRNDQVSQRQGLPDRKTQAG